MHFDFLKYLLKYFYVNHAFYCSIIIPILFLPIPILYPDPAIKCAYGSLVTALFLITQALPIPIASLIPIFIFPCLGIMNLKDVSANYMKDPITLFLASLIIAQAIENVDLHRRISLNLLLLFGSTSIWLMLGILSTTFFISMWINNTAVAALITPIVAGIMKEFQRLKHAHTNGDFGTNLENGKDLRYSNTETNLQYLLSPTKNMPAKRLSIGENIIGVDYMPNLIDNAGLNAEEFSNISNNKATNLQKNRSNIPHSLSSLHKALFISVAYGANLGGTGSLTGTGPNLIMTGIMTQLFGPSAEISFAKWLIYSCPGAIIILILTWIALAFIFLGFGESFNQIRGRSSRRMADPKPFIRQQLNLMGNVKQEETTVMITFVLLVIVWILKDPKFMPGWQSWFPPNTVNDTTPAILLSLLYFIIPRDFSCLNPFLHMSKMHKLTTSKDVSDPETTESLKIVFRPILTWNDVQNKLMWDVILLFGGGMAISACFRTSGLSKLLVKWFAVFSNTSPLLICILFTTITSFLTELMSNISTASILVPLMAELAVSLKINPHYLVFPVTLAASYSFMLPIATGPNAIVYSAGDLSFWDMLLPGFIVNFIGVIVCVVSINTYAKWTLGTGTFPNWASNFKVNSTSMIQ